MKKRVVAALLCGVMVAGTMSVQAQSVLADEGTTITVMASQDWVYDAEMELGKQFEEETGIKVDYQIVPADQYYNMLMTKLNSGEGPDIFGGQSGSFDIVSQYNVEKNAVDLSDQAWVDTYDEFAKEQTSVDGKVYGMTYYDVSTDYYVVYNKKIFEENGLEVPTTYAEFEEVCQTLLDNDIVPIYEPCADGWHQTMWFTEIGGKYEELVPGIVDDLNNNKIKFADVPELKEALDQLNDMAQKGYFGDNYLSDEYTDLLMNLGSGEYAMALEKPGQISAIAEASDGKYTEDDFGMFVIPLMDNDVYPQHPCGPSRFVYSGSEHQEEAKQYLEYIASADSVQYMIDNCDKIENLPFDVGQTPSYSEETQTFLDAAEKEGTVFQDSIKYLNPQWTELTQDIVSMFIGDMTSEDVLNAIDERRATQAEAVGDENWQ
ncbi:MAG TPA: ABC transporter substrate-binding protein [Candidatus Blautia intestinipullorum]|nr:ABC transporter substrate-binding protein [Candidatus Blautia intestinipullorum]